MNKIQLILIVFGAFFLLNSCKEKLEDLDVSKVKTKDFTLVEVSDVEISNKPIPIYSIGKVASEEEVKLSFKVGGIISEINGDEGQSIRKGVILAKLRTDEIDAQVTKAKTALQKAQRDLERVQSMYNEGAATLENIQDLTTQVKVLEADVNVTKFNQQYARIKSPVSGRILKRNAEANELISPGQPVFIISSRQGSLLIKASLSDKDISKINYGDTAKIYFDAFPNETFEGILLRISESADPRTGTFEVDIEIREKGKRLRHGYIGRVEIYPSAVQSYFKIPIDALVEGKQEEVTIFLPSDDRKTAIKMNVKPEYIGNDYFTVSKKDDLNLNQVITTGAPYLLDQGKIQIKE